MYIEDTGKSTGDHNVMIDHARERIFNFSYPIFNTAYRSKLEKKILGHFYTREIGFETYGLWHLKLQQKMNEIMPYYNQLYESEELKFNPLENTDYRTETDAENKTQHGKTLVERIIDENDNTRVRDDRVTVTYNTNEQTVYNDEVRHIYDSEEKTKFGKNEKTTYNSTTSSNGSTTTDETKQHSDTPQGGLDALKTGKYMSQGDVNHGTSTGSGSDKKTGDDTVAQTGDETLVKSGSDTDAHSGEDSHIKTGNDNTKDDDYERTTVHNDRKHDTNEGGETKDLKDEDTHVHGKTGSESYAKFLNEFRETFLNIDMMVINDLEELFMLIW